MHVYVQYVNTQICLAFNGSGVLCYFGLPPNIYPILSPALSYVCPSTGEINWNFRPRDTAALTLALHRSPLTVLDTCLMRVGAVDNPRSEDRGRRSLSQQSHETRSRRTGRRETRCETARLTLRGAAVESYDLACVSAQISTRALAITLAISAKKKGKSQRGNRNARTRSDPSIIFEREIPKGGRVWNSG